MSTTTTTAAPRTTHRRHYAPPPFLVDTVALDLTLDEGDTRVTATLTLRRNPSSPTKTEPLVLDGAVSDAFGSGPLVAIAKDGVPLPADSYSLDADTLTIHAPGDRLVLSTTRRLSPKDNASLEGLYASGSGLFTQCEAEGFRKITWFPDRPDVLSTYTVTLRAKRSRFPVLLSNGNKQSELDDGEWRVATWHDPWPKPCYLFAVVAADLVARSDSFTTASGKQVTLNIWVQAHDRDQTAHCMESLKKSMAWDETRFGREYDLDVFNLVAVSDFNMGAMENKGLNIFNTKYVLARPDTATDVDFDGIEAVVGHEYFHNWSGNRVTCRDWFQLSLKEGFTVYRDQEFSSDVGSRAVKRIDEVRRLRSLQFPEDAGPTAHPVRPDSYVEISNFYTVTIYEKGAEVVRLYETILGRDMFRKGTDLYFARHDGQAATCDDFLAAMAEVSGRDLTQFSRWYGQAGTPAVTSSGQYDAEQATYTLTLTQTMPPTPGQPDKLPMVIPVTTALLGKDGRRVPLIVDGKPAGDEVVLELDAATRTFVFGGVGDRPVPSLLRGFSAPVKLTTDDNEASLRFRLAYDDDPFNRVEAGQELYLRELELGVDGVHEGREPWPPSPELIEALKTALASSLLPGADHALLALALSLPGLDVVGDRLGWADYTAAHRVREGLVTTLARAMAPLLAEVDAALSRELDGRPYAFEPRAVGLRSLRNLIVSWRSRLDEEHAYAHLQRASCMTDVQTALALVALSRGPRREAAFADFYARWRGEALMIDKWFTLQAQSTRAGAIDDVTGLLSHEAFSLKNPNRARALVSAFAMGNPLHFHDASGRGYAFLGEQVRALDAFNPQIAARFLTPLTRWRRQDAPRQEQMKSELRRVLERPACSRDVFEIASKALA
ncbi:MAG: aminopeptidase N [Deltaproteobacteria bacterium]|nr:aminopeptidase N [Deltaproteobacteria bacterium]